MAIGHDLPTSCDNEITPFSEVIKGQITSTIRSAHHYYLTSNDPGVGQTYEERMANFAKKATKILEEFMDERIGGYRKTRCSYHKETKANRGKTKKNELIVEPGFYFITETLEHTTNGNWKKGPDYLPDSNQPFSFSWVTGGHRSSHTYVDIQAKYTDLFIRNTVGAELESIRIALYEAGVPVKIPPIRI